jgi:hypothetical protein
VAVRNRESGAGTFFFDTFLFQSNYEAYASVEHSAASVFFRSLVLR